jgi:hypothetical protein
VSINSLETFKPSLIHIPTYIVRQSLSSSIIANNVSIVGDVSGSGGVGRGGCTERTPDLLRDLQVQICMKYLPWNCVNSHLLDTPGSGDEALHASLKIPEKSLTCKLVARSMAANYYPIRFQGQILERDFRRKRPSSAVTKTRYCSTFR